MLPDDDEIRPGDRVGFRAIVVRERDEFTGCRLRRRYVGVLRAIDDTRQHLCLPGCSGDQDIFGPLLRLFAFRIPQGIFSLFPRRGAARRRVSPHVSTARIHLSTRNPIVPIVHMRVCKFVQPAFVCGPVKLDPMHAQVKTICVLGNRREDTRQFCRLTLLQREQITGKSGVIFDDGITAAAKLFDRKDDIERTPHTSYEKTDFCQIG